MTKEKFLRVTDSSCTAEHPVREHSVNVRGVIIPVVFRYGEDTLLPFEQGMKFSKLDGFKVEETDGTNLVIPAVTSEALKSTLAKNEVIAKLGELTLSSLKLRASSLPGGEIYLESDEDSREDLIAFIIGDAPAGAPEPKAETVDDEGEGDDSVIDVSKPVNTDNGDLESEEDANGAAGLTGELNEKLEDIRAQTNTNHVHAGALEPGDGSAE